MKLTPAKIVLIVLLSFSTTLSAAASKEAIKLINEAKKEAGEIEAKKLMEMIDDEEDVIVLDVREAKQRSEGLPYVNEITPIAIQQVTRGNLEFFIDKKVKNRDAVIVTFCRSGGRGALSAQTLKHLGYKNAVNLKGGLKGWTKAGYPVKLGFGVVKLAK